MEKQNKALPPARIDAAIMAPVLAAAGIAELDRPLPLSWTQERMWLLRQLQPQSSAYHAEATIRLVGELDPSLLARSLQAVVSRHAVLRTRIPLIDGRPQQVVCPDCPIPLALHDLSPPAAQDLPAGDLPAQNATAQDLQAQNAKAQDFHARDLPSQDLPAQNASAQDLHGRNVPAQNATAQDLPAPDFPSQDLQARLADALEAPFDLERGPLVRASLYRLGPDDHILQVVAHNAVADTASMAVLVRELAALYTSQGLGQPSPLADLPFQYADYACWERANAASPAASPAASATASATASPAAVPTASAAASPAASPTASPTASTATSPAASPTPDAVPAFWRRHLDDVPPLSLPTDRPRPAVQSTHGASLAASLPPDLLDQLAAVARAGNTSLDLVLLTAWALLLGRYSGQEDFAVGLPMANRPTDATQQLIGPFEDVLPLRIDLSGAPTFAAALRRIAAAAAEVSAHANMPFELLVKELHPVRAPSHTPFFQVMFNRAAPAWGELHFGGLTWARVPVATRSTQLDLTLDVISDAAAPAVDIEYNTDLFDAATISRMLAQYQVLLEGIAAHPEQPIARLPLLPAAERHLVLDAWNATAKDFPQHACIHELFEAQAARTPDAPAVLWEGGHLTYAELNRRANQLAHHLQTLGVRPETLVGIHALRSFDLIVGLLGILKAGGAYLPLDPNYPPDRLAFMLADAGVDVLLTQAPLLDELPPFGGRVVCLDTDWDALAQSPAQNPPPRAGATNLVYVIYTSGSTGQPKGTQIEHRSLVNYVVDMAATLNIGPGDRLLQFASISFDAAAEEIFCTLAHGATLVLRTDAMIESMATFLEACRDLELTILDLPTAYWHALTIQLAHGDIALPPSVRVMLIGGDAALPERLQAWRQHAGPHVRFINAYGPTEATIVATKWELPSSLATPAALAVLPIGRPVANTEVYLLDRELQPVPIGVPGELHIGGAGLARGYLHRPDLTAAKFIPNPFRPGARLYKTGDLARFLPDGNLEFLGRRDNQVKVRGYRIELGEIEIALNEHASVAKGVVLAWDDSADGKQVVAYVEGVGGTTPGTTPDPAELRRYLEARLPGYMVPAAIVVLDVIPLTANDKIDRKRLPHPKDLALPAGSEYAAPRTPLEEELTRIWARALGRDRVGIRDHFFELGGSSLQAALLFIEIEARTGHRLPLATLFQAPTIEHLAAVIADDSWTAPWNPLVPIQPHGSHPPFFCVHGHGGDVVGYHELARQLGPDQPFYGLQAKGLNGRDEPHSNVDSMAADYVRWVRSVQPHGPYYLGGYCYGGVVAFEMARQLEAAGEEVRLVAVMEGYAVERSAVRKQLWRPTVIGRLLRNLPYWLKDNFHPEGPYLRNWKTRGYNPAAELPDRKQVLDAHDLAMAAYKPGPYRGRVTLLRVKTLSLFRAHDPAMGWADVAAGGVDIRMVPGAHYNILEQPHVAGLAEQLRRCLV